jgi:predicted secreted protein
MGSLVITDDRDQVTDVRLVVCEQLEVAVAENATTGFAWRAYTDASDVVQIVDSRFEAPGTSAVGAAGVRRLVVAARQAGEAVLTLELRRSWETDQPPGRRVTVSIAVGAAQ